MRLSIIKLRLVLQLGYQRFIKSYRKYFAIYRKTNVVSLNNYIDFNSLTHQLTKEWF